MLRRAAPALILLLLAPGLLSAQYFGRNKVQYSSFDFKVIQTEHFDVYYYERERVAAMDAARMAERGYARLSKVLNHEFRERKPIILYASHSDFQQTNALGQAPGEGTGGVTDFQRNRAVMPFTGMETFKLHEVTRHHLDVALGSDPALLMINRKRYDALPAEVCPLSSPSILPCGSPKAWRSICRWGRSIPRPRCGSGTRPWKARSPPSSR